MHTKQFLTKSCFAFNIWDIELAEIFAKLCFKYSMPSILQVSENIAKGIDLNLFTAQVNLLKQKYPNTIFLNLDHAQNKELVKLCIDLKWDMVMCGGSNLLLKENIAFTKELVDYAHNQGVLVEGEIEPVLEVCSEEHIQSTNLAEIKKFVQDTDVDFLAIPIGTRHGMSSDDSISIDYNLLHQAFKELDTNLVLHGGSGLSISTFNKCFLAGVKKINISTEIKEIYEQTIKDFVNTEKDLRYVNQELFFRLEIWFKEKLKALGGLS